MWKQYESVWYKPGKIGNDNKNKVAAFDLDSTLIFSDRGEKYAEKGWIWAYDKIPEYMNLLNSEGWIVVIFSNRKGSPWMINAAKKRIDQVIQAINVPIWAFLATKDDKYRKPNIGMWCLFSRLIPGQKYGIFVGDAAGDRSLIPRGRWSNADINFAHNVGLHFYEPQQILPNFKLPSVEDIKGIKLILACGQSGSKVDEFKQYDGKILTIPKPINISYYITSKQELSTGNITVIFGLYNLQSERIKLFNTLNLSNSECIIFWYAGPPLCNPVFFEPPTTRYFRLE